MYKQVLYRNHGIIGGYAALTTLVLVLLVSMSVVSGFSFFTFREVEANRAFTRAIESRGIAESGLEDAVYRVVKGKQITNGELLGVGNGTTTLLVTTVGSTKTIRSEGVESAAQQNWEAQVGVTVAGTNFPYGAQVGDGGLEMENNSSIAGSVYSNGDIVGGNGATITGDAFVAGASNSIEEVTIGGNAGAHTMDDVTVGGNADAYTFSNGITGGNINANSISKCTVGGNAAFNIISNCVIIGTQTIPTIPPTDPAPLPFPIAEETITTWKSDAAVGGIITGNYSVTADVSLGPKEITGNLLMNTNNKTLTITGTLYVHGNIDISNGAIVRCASSYGTNSCLLLSDGWIHIQNNGTFQGSGTVGSYLMLLTNATGGGHHGSAIDLHNNASGAIFYASNGMIFLHNNVTVSELVGYKVHLENSATLIYEIGLQDVHFSSGPTGGFDIIYWKEVQ